MQLEERDFPGSALINKGKGNLTIVLLLAVFVIIELSLFRLHSFPLTRGETDGIGYMDRATGPLFQAHPFHGPGYSTAIRAIQSIGVAPFASAKVISLVFGMVFILSTWLILRSFSSSPESFLATTFVAFSPVTLVRSATILSDMMAASLFLATLALLVVPRETKAWHFALAGLVAGLAYLTRYIYILLVAVPLIYMAFWIRGQSRRSFALIRMGVFYLGFVVITLPWFIFLWKTKGNPLWNENYLNIAFKMHQHARGWNVFT
jgi:predicted membrane-bound mannosyltransferase